MTAGRPKRDAGYAVLAAMVCAAGAALTAAELTATSRNAALTAGAEAARARMEADADAGFAMAMAGLEDSAPASRWTLDGAPHTLDFGDAELSISVEDERGKIPLNTITAPQAGAMFRLAGADAEAADALAAAFMLQRDPSMRSVRDDDAPSPAPPQAAPPQSTAGGAAAASQRAGLTAVRDLLLLPGMTPELYAALSPSVSVSVRDASFEPRTAAPLALEVMMGATPGSPALIERQRELAGEAAALDAGPALVLAGRPLTIRVRVQDRRGDRLQSARVVELTRAPTRPYVVRLLSADGA